ncbi:MAG: cadherin-like beta sandwich domain-containing protein [Spirochaetia bacterium]|nr:cadherin-like beta sandwich domain-containing protein [Spirochaetia bacterium]
MKKNLKTMMILLSVFLVSCSGELSRGTDSKNQKFASIVINKNDIEASRNSQGRALDINAKITKARISVTSSDMQTPVSQDVTVSNGQGTISISGIPCGKNRIISVTPFDEDGTTLLSGWKISSVIDVNEGENPVTVNWTTTSKARVYEELSKNKDITSFSVEQNESISAAVPQAVAYYVNTAQIAVDFIAGNLKAAASYLLTQTATLTFEAKNAIGYEVIVEDPLSETKTITANGFTSVAGIAPGTWKVVVSDGTDVVSTKTVTFTSGTATDIGVIGNLLQDKMIIFVKAKSAPKIWVWQANGGVTDGSKLLGTTWDNRPSMVPATTDYMVNPSGWYMFDLEGCNYTQGIAFNFKLNDAANIETEKTATFWYDGSKFYDKDPSANMPSEDATLSSISINGTPVDSFSKDTTSYSVTVESSVETVTVLATKTHAKATVKVSPEGSVAVAAGESVSFAITVTAEDGTTEKTYNVSVRRAIENDTTLSKVLVNGKSASEDSSGNYSYEASGSAESFEITSVSAVPNDENATITYSESSGSVTEASPKTITITVKNGTKSSSYTLTVSYKVLAQNQYYWTNKDGAVGIEKTISSWDDWTEDMRIAQCAAYDDPRTWRGNHEIPYDAYALYAAYDNTNLYIMVELTNAADRAKFMYYDYAASDNAWWDNRDTPLGLAINTGKTKTVANGPVLDSGDVIWGSAIGGINFNDAGGMNYILYHSSKYGYSEHKKTFVGVGTPGFFKLKESTGTFSYEPSYCLTVNKGTEKGTSGIDIKYKRNLQVSKNVWCENSPAEEEDPINQNRASSLHQTGEDLMASATYIDLGTKSDLELDMSYWYTIPLSTLGIDKNYLTTKGISIRQLTTNGGSLMDCIPWDPCMVDIAAGECSDDPSTSAEKRDIDNITTPQARIGHM